MPTIKFTAALSRFFPGLRTITAEGQTIASVLKATEKQYPGLLDYIVDESGELRQHVNIYIGDDLIKDRIGLQDRVKTTDEIYIMQALSGG